MMYPAEVQVLTKTSAKGNEYTVFEIKFANGYVWKSQSNRCFLSDADKYVIEMNQQFQDGSVLKAVTGK